MNVALVQGVAAQGKGRRATLDHDATIQESHKRPAQWHYKGGRGYQPAAIYWGEQDLVVADEYRDGNVPAAMDNLPLIQRGFASLPATVTEYYFRADSACYDARVLKWLANAQRPGGAALPGAADSPAAGAAVRGGLRHEAPGGGDQSDGGAGRAGPLALAEGGDDRVGA
ncbi:MAG: transposase [Candidatus Rokubacteria bacterium]|nr:transposase [Candidatus Rokubacteria bacterium]